MGLTLLGQLQHVHLLALLGASAVRRDKRIHEGLEVRSVPLGEGVCDVPVVVCCFGCAERACGCEAFIQALFEAFDLVHVGAKVVAGSETPLV